MAISENIFVMLKEEKSDFIKTDGGIDMSKTKWHLKGEWFDVCSCKLPCPCTFAQEPTNGDCLFTLVWQVHEGYYNDIRLDGFGVVALGEFAGICGLAIPMRR